MRRLMARLRITVPGFKRRGATQAHLDDANRGLLFPASRCLLSSGSAARYRRMHATEAMDELMTCRLDHVRKALEPCTLVIFGASGDLTSRKLVPALYHLAAGRQMPADFRIVGFARREKSSVAWRGELREALEKYGRGKPVDAAEWEAFAARVDYLQGDLGNEADYLKLAGLIDTFPSEPLRRNLVFYLATSPSQFSVVAERLHGAKLLQRLMHEHWQRLVVEKPFGHDLASARELNHELTRFAHEQQVFRIDHYLGKETVQNILTFRFANAIFERLWNRDAVDHIQITLGEQGGVGTRGGYYEEAGALRDMVQNHLMQVLALVAMEPPVALDAEPVRDEKVKLLSSVRRMSPEQVARQVVRGQYRAGEVAGRPQVAYRDEPKVSPRSDVETFVALKLYIDNWRWAGVPIYLRTGGADAIQAHTQRVVRRAMRPAARHQLADPPPAAERGHFAQVHWQGPGRRLRSASGADAFQL